MLDRLDASMRFQQEALRLRTQRQEVLSSNIANADTPQYKARDFDFSAALSQAVGREGGPVALAQTAARHLGARGHLSGGPDMLYRQPMQSSMDGNTVEMDTERVSFAENAVRYEVGLTVLSGKIKSMLSAVQS